MSKVTCNRPESWGCLDVCEVGESCLSIRDGKPCRYSTRVSTVKVGLMRQWDDADEVKACDQICKGWAVEWVIAIREIANLQEGIDYLASLFSEKCEECDGLRQTVADYQDEVAVLKSGAMVPLPETTPDRAVISPHTRGKPKRCPNCGHVAYRCKCLDLARADFSQADDTPTEGEGQSGASGGDSEGKEVIVRFDGNDEGSGILPTMAGAVDLTASGDDERPQAHPSEGLVSHNPHYPHPGVSNHTHF